MNTETGQIYHGFEAMRAAINRGEPVVEVSGRVAGFMELGQKAADVPTLGELRERIEALEKRDDIERRMKALGLVLPDHLAT